MLEKSCAVPAALDRDLGQQQAAAALPTDEQTVAADFDFLGANRLRGRQDAQLNFQMRGFFFGYGRETVVVKGGGAGGFRYGTVDRAGGLHVADTSAQFFSALIFSALIFSTRIVAQVKRSEDAAEFGEVRRGRIQRDLAMLQGGGNGIMRQAEQLSAFRAGKFLDGSHC